MSDEQILLIAADCPKGHRPAQRYTPARLRELLDTGTLRFYCYQCDSQFPATEEAITNLWQLVAPTAHGPCRSWRNWFTAGGGIRR